MSRWLLRRRNALLSICSTSNGYANESNPGRLTSPPPIQVGFTESAGRGVFATRRIGAGELIHTAEPILSHPSLSSLHSVCYFCLRNLQREASNVLFCSDECREQSKIFYQTEEQADWSGFHEYCRTQGLKYPLLVKRLACMIISGVATPETLDILQPAMLSSEMILLMEKEYQLLRSTFEDAGFTDEQIAFLSKHWYIDVLARIRINSFRIELALGSYEDILLSAAASVEAEAAVGNAIYMLPSFYNHDCDPNAHILWIESVHAKLKALCDIEAGLWSSGKSATHALGACHEFQINCRQSLVFKWRRVEGRTHCSLRFEPCATVLSDILVIRTIYVQYFAYVVRPTILLRQTSNILLI